ncbi:YbaB/EbfC family nucleoid-associated protein [Ancylobacter sp. G4_0304]|uniref:YbaB/EbfC family nucleoid-associated protein n=1 Tax=Ancylobacter sp. G4_0304 TaxID=3114289 RepID=UPI0039C70A27
MKDLLGMMSKVKEMQARMEQMQAELDSIEVEGASGGGMVKVTLTAKGALKAISIDPSLYNPDEAEILEDLIVAAHAEARAKSERLVQEKTQALTAGLPIPPGLKLF